MKMIIAISAITGLAVLSSSFTQDPKAESIKRGLEVYSGNCQSCHMEKGEGVENSIPPLAKSDYLMKAPQRAIQVILKGQSEAITVNGKQYNMLMPAQDYLSDDQIADVINYISNSWGNSYKKVITAAQVKDVRK